MSSKAIRAQVRSQDDIFDKSASLCLKGVAIQMLIAHHCFLRPSRYEGQDITFVIPESVWNYVTLYFKICVCLFAFISAYAMTKKLMAVPEGKSRRNYYTQLSAAVVSRLVRLLGGFIFVFLLVDLFALVYDPGRLTEIYGTSLFSFAEYFLIDMLGLAELLGTPTFLGTYWYYSLAIVLILLAPVFYLMIKRMGTPLFLGLVTVLCFTVKTVSLPNSDMRNYFLTVAVGVACAYENWITRMVKYHVCEQEGKNRLLKFLAELIILLALMALREGVLKKTLYPFWNAVIPPVMTAFLCEFFFGLPHLRRVLMFFGKYSANIFLVHNYIRHVWFRDFTYSFRYPLAIVAVLFGISLALSIAIEGLKKLVRYPRLVGFAERTLVGWHERIFGEPIEERL